MSRPKSMPDFSHLLNMAPSPPPDKERPRKKPSISLAAGLIMNSESPKATPSMPYQNQAADSEERWSENLFYAYAQKFGSPLSPPYILTFANASVAHQWWSIVQSEYPSSTREGPQLFILQGDDMQDQIQDNPKFYELRNKWFYTPCNGATSLVPLQDERGNLIGGPGTTQSAQKNSLSPSESQESSARFDLSSLSATLGKMSSMISENTSQIQALSVAQSAGLQRMQEINESNSTQIKALADGQANLQSLISENASHFIALSNHQFSNQEQIKGVLQQNAAQIKSLADGHASQSSAQEDSKTIIQQNADQIKSLADSQMKLSETCAEMMKAVTTLTSSFPSTSSVASAPSDTPSSVGSLSPAAHRNGYLSPASLRVSPPPRKLNRRIKGVWYEYDATPPSLNPPSMTLETPPKSPEKSSTKTTKSVTIKV